MISYVRPKKFLFCSPIHNSQISLLIFFFFFNVSLVPKVRKQIYWARACLSKFNLDVSITQLWAGPTFKYTSSHRISRFSTLCKTDIGFGSCNICFLVRHIWFVTLRIGPLFKTHSMS